MSDSLRSHGLQPTRLLCPWDFPGNSTGVDCHFLLQQMFENKCCNVIQNTPEFLRFIVMFSFNESQKVNMKSNQRRKLTYFGKSYSETECRFLNINNQFRVEQSDLIACRSILTEILKEVLLGKSSKMKKRESQK